MQTGKPLVVVVMGVSGSGKTTIGALLAERLRWPFADADEFHSAANIAKMHTGTPLDDADREPWLEAIAARIDAWLQQGTSAIVTCSALKRSYRDSLVRGRSNVRLLYLRGDRELLEKRLAVRRGHFMPAALLASQLETLEEPGADERPAVVALAGTPAQTVDAAIAALELDH